MDTTQVRTDFPEFADTTAYPESAIKFWLNVAEIMLDSTRWGALLNVGTELFVAHHLVLGKGNSDQVAAGGNPGKVTGILTAKAVDKVSMSMDAGSVSLTDQGFWGMSSYGIRFLQFARQIGSGGMQL